MKNVRSILNVSFMAVCLIFFGCKKADTSGKESVSTKNKWYDGVISILTSTSATGEVKGHIDINFYDENKNLVDVGKVLIGSFIIRPEANQINGRRVPYLRDKSFPVTSKDVVGFGGKDIEIKTDGNVSTGFEPINTTLYIPNPIKSSMIFTHRVNTLKAGQPLVVTWVPDIKGGNTMMIEIHSFNKPTEGHSNEYHQYNLEDNGKFTIPWSVLDKFDKNTDIDISLYRYSTQEIEMGQKEVLLWSYNNYFLGEYRFPRSITSSPLK